MSDLAAIPFQFMTSFDNTASVGIAVVDELHNFDLEKCDKSSRRHRAVSSRRIIGTSNNSSNRPNRVSSIRGMPGRNYANVKDDEVCLLKNRF